MKELACCWEELELCLALLCPLLNLQLVSGTAALSGVQGAAQLCAAELTLLLFDFKGELVIITFKFSIGVVAG